MKIPGQSFSSKVIMSLLFLILPWTGFNQTITGPIDVCIGSQGTYIFTAPAGYTIDHWNVSSQGSVIGGPPGTASAISVLWNAAGAGNVDIYYYPTGPSPTLTAYNYAVTIYPNPEPVVTWDAQVGCQIADTASEHTKSSIDDGHCLRVCEYSTVTYTVSNPGAGSSFSWLITGGTIIGTPGVSCTVQWGALGNGNVQVTETTNPYGCQGTTSFCIEKIGSPHALFIVKPFTVDENIVSCVNKDLIFQDLSDPGNGTPIISWYWDFGDGSFSPLQNPIHSYMNPGGYTAHLTVVNQCGCTSTYERDIDILPEEGMVIQCPTVVCENAQVDYWLEPFDQAVQDCIDAGTATWTVSGSNTPGGTVNQVLPNGHVLITWDQMSGDTLGFGYIYFTPSADCGIQCPTPTVARVPVVQDTGYIQGPTVLCPNQKQYLFKLPQWPATVFNWTIQTSTGAILIPTDQPNEYIVQTDQQGTITLKVTYHNTMRGCDGTAIKELQVLPPEVVIGPTTVCANSSEGYSLSSGYVGDWVLQSPGGTQTGSGTTFTANFGAAGHYTLTVTGTDFCGPDPIDITVLGKPPIPDSLLGPDTVCAGTPYVFTAKNSYPGTIFHWSVAGGTFSGSTTGNQVSISFNPGGPYTVMVWRELVQSPHCASDTLTKTVYPPTVNVAITGPDTACAFTYQNYSSGYYQGETYEWSIEPNTIGSVSTGDGTPDVTVLWNQASPAQNAMLIVKVRKCGVYYRDTLNVWVEPTPVISITAQDSICQGDVVNASINPTLSSFNTIMWDFGDGTIYPNNSQSANHTYLSAVQNNTTYTIGVVVTSPNGCFTNATATHEVIVKPAPVANITPSGPFELCDTVTTLPATIYANVQSGFGSTSAIRWYRNGVLVSAGGPTNNSYNVTILGSYYAVVFNTNGCSATTNTVEFVHKCPDTCLISPYPVVTAYDTLSACGEVHLGGTYQFGGFDPFWDYPLVATSWIQNGNSAIATFDKAGNYRFIFSVAFANGMGDTCWISDTKHVIVPYIAGLKYAVSCSSTPGYYDVTLFDHSNFYPPTPIQNYAFYINNTSTPVQSGAGTNYTTALTPGTYPIAIKISSPGYPDCWAYDTLVLPAMPVASFSYSPDSLPTCVGYPVSFTSLATPVTIPALTHAWDFGDLALNMQINPQRVFQYPIIGNSYSVNLTVTNIYGCSDDTTITVNIHANGLDGTLSATPNSPCEGEPVNLIFSNAIGSVPNLYTWFEDVSLITSTTSNTLNVFTPGSYWVQLSDQYHCIKNIDPVTVDFTKVPPAQIIGETDYCVGGDFTLYGYAGPDVTDYEWFRNGLLTASGNVPELIQTGLAAGTYNYTLVISIPKPGGGFCTDTSAVFTVNINNPPPDPVISFNIDCGNYTVELTATNTVAGTYTWSNGMNGTPIYVTSGGPYKVYFHDGSGCITTDEEYVPKDPEVYLWVFPDGCFDLCEQVMAQNQYVLYGPIIPFNFWEWANNYYTQNGSGVVSPYVVNVAGQHTLTLDNGFCSRTSKPMNVTAHSCDCPLDMKILSQWSEHTDDGGCINYVDMFISNASPYTISVTINSADGYFVPSTVIVPPGGNTYVLQFVPTGGFTGGTTTITLSGTMNTSEGPMPFYCEFEYTFTDLCPPNRPAGNATTGNNITSAGGSLLTLAPNPAANTTVIHYRYADGRNTKRSIEVYDMTGRMVIGVPVSEKEGTVTLDLTGFAGGMYLVIMKQQGAVIEKQKLSVIGK